MFETLFVVKRFVVVAEVPVAFMNVKFCRVVDPVTNKSPPILAKKEFGSK